MINENSFKPVDYFYIVVGIAVIFIFTYMAIQPRLSHLKVKAVQITALR